MPTDKTKQLARDVIDALHGVSSAEAHLKRAQEDLQTRGNELKQAIAALEKDGEDGTYICGEYIITRSTATYATEPTRRSTVQIQRAIDVSMPEY